MRLQRLEIVGFKSFAKKSDLLFTAPISAVVGPNGSGKSNVAEAIRFVLGEQSVKSMRGKRGEDLIWNGSEKVGRLNHAKVTIVFDNTDGAFNIDFPEVSISREVFRDNSNQYYINGSQVRLKDIVELLASVHIGASSHHIISQGEADRILNASPKERKLMIEDALGLKIFHLRITEAARKLEKTHENSKEVDLLRREIAPHLRYLKKQVEKIEQGKVLKTELGEMYKEYLRREEIFIGEEHRRITDTKNRLLGEKEMLESELGSLEAKVGQDTTRLPEEEQKQTVEAELRSLREEKANLNREVGKYEGMLEYEERRSQKPISGGEQTAPPVPYVRIESSLGEVLGSLDQVEHEGDLGRVKELVAGARTSLRGFLSKWKGGEESTEVSQDNSNEIAGLQATLEELRTAFEAVVRAEEGKVTEIQELLKRIDAAKGEVRAAERELYEKKAVRGQLLTRLESIRSEEMRHSGLKTRFEEEVQDAVQVLGRDASAYQSYEIDAEVVMGEERSMQEKRRRDIERARVRLEDIGFDSGEDVLKEYKEVSERDSFLEKELADLRASAQSLEELIADLNVKLETEFTEGVAKINSEFGQFFTLMFGGGKADLRVVEAEKRKRQIEGEDEIPPVGEEEEEQKETGIDVSVALPGKKTRGLVMLSGGERALTSIALLFAISRVNPPPFMILDETDAALDEANSRKYGDMLENLSEHSQLIVITHNRETMSRAGVLYGITVGSDAVSRMLSVKFDEAVAVAK